MFFKPLLADRIDFREWETFFLGTARRIEGKSSRKESRVDVQLELAASRGKVRAEVDEEKAGGDEEECSQGRDQDGRRKGWKSRGVRARNESRVGPPMIGRIAAILGIPL